MKETKKVFSFLMAVMMMFSIITVPARAEGTDEPEEGTGQGWRKWVEQLEGEPEEAMTVIPGTEPAPAPSYPAINFSDVAVEGSDIIVNVEAPEGALPEGTEISVKPINDAGIMETAKEAVDANAQIIALVDISFSCNGEEVEPEKEITVSIRSAEITADKEYQVVHIDDDLVAEKLADDKVENDGDTVSFTNDEFSIYAVVSSVNAIKPGAPAAPQAGAGLTVYYVDESGNPIHTSTTLPTPSNTYGYTNPYDIVIDIDGYTYHNTFINGYTASTGTQIIPELVARNNNRDWTYVKYGLADWVRQNGNGPEKYNAFANGDTIYVVYGDAYLDDNGSSSGGSDDETPDMKPQAGKVLTNNNDGTYTLSLSITGKGATTSETNGANVIMVFDTSSSMTRYNTDGSTHRANDGKTTRLDAAKESAQSVATELLGMNTEENPDLVEMYLVDFDYFIYNNNTNEDAQGNPYNTWYTEAGSSTGDKTTEFNALIQGLDVATGTNWEAALKEAKRVADAKNDGDATYIIFITDGNPSARIGTNEEYGVKYSAEPTTSTQNIDATSNNDYTYYNRNNNYLRATDDARALVQAGYYFYSVGIYGNVDVLANLTNFAYNGRSTKANTGHYFPAASTEKLNEALSSIAKAIKNTLSLAGVSFEDGIATDVTSTTIAATTTGTIQGVTYTKTGGSSGNYTVKVEADGTPVFTIDGSEYDGITKNVSYTKISTNDSGQIVTQDGATADIYSYTDPNGKEYRMSIASYDKNGELVWDLSPLGTLEEGATYRISFIVWPDQDAYDYVANLNNGISGYTWDTTLPTYHDYTSDKGYEIGGVEEYPNIVRYPNGTFGALTNTHQDVEYYIANTDEDNVTTYSAGEPVTLIQPNPADLTSTSSKITKKWNVDLAKEQLISFLYNTYTGASLEKSITFSVYQDDEFYRTATLGWVQVKDENGDPVLDGEGNPTYDYVWGDTTESIEYYGKTYDIGTVWQDDFAISTGILLSETRMNALGLDKTKYQSVEYGEGEDATTYYVLERGHDYTVSEPTLSYSFDFVNKTYHPMLVDGQLRNVFFEYDGVGEDGKKKIVGITNVEEMSDGIRVDNTLRGGINLNKAVTQADETTKYETDDLFTFHIELNNEKEGIFTETVDSVPWYGIKKDGIDTFFYYHDEDWNLYQVRLSRDDAGNVIGVTVTTPEGTYTSSTLTFHESVGPEDVTYTVDGEEVTVALYGNALTPNADGTQATGDIEITQSETLRIANVPINTTYTISETPIKGYELFDITKDIQLGDEHTPVTEGIDVENYKVDGEIEANRENNIVFKNKVSDDVFYVYHSSNNKIEKISFADKRVTKEMGSDNQYKYSFNIVDEVLKDNLYGGYFSAYKGVSTGFDATMLSYESENSGEYVYETDEIPHPETGMWATDSGTKYDGSKIGQWSKKVAYSQSGFAMNPEVNAVYYLKEVPDDYFRAASYYIYDDYSEEKDLKHVYLIVPLDDSIYQFTSGEPIDISQVKSLYSTFKTTASDGSTKSFTAKDVNPKLTRGYLAVWNIDSMMQENAEYTWTPYFVTLDGIKVTSVSKRTINMGNLCYGSSDTNFKITDVKVVSTAAEYKEN